MLSAEILEADPQQAPAACEKGPANPALRRSTSASGKNAFLTDPDLRTQLGSLLGVKSSLLLGALDRLRVEADPYAFLPKGLTPELRQFWGDNFGTAKQVTWKVFASKMLADDEIRSLVQQLEARLREEHAVAAAMMDASSKEGGVFVHLVLRSSLDLDGDGTVHASDNTASQPAMIRCAYGNVLGLYAT